LGLRRSEAGNMVNEDGCGNWVPAVVGLVDPVTFYCNHRLVGWIYQSLIAPPSMLSCRIPVCT